MEELVIRIAKWMESKKFGKYRGFVIDNKDPEKRGRLKLNVPGIAGETDWALPCLPYGGMAEQGLFLVPEIDAQVWAEFEEGDIDRPIWSGTFWQTGTQPPSEAALAEPKAYVLKTPGGHLLKFDDTADAETVKIQHSKGASVTIDPDGTVLIEDAKGNMVTLDANAEEIGLEDSSGNAITMSSSGITMEDANGNKVAMESSGITLTASEIVLDADTVKLGGKSGKPVIKGSSFLTAYGTHTHPSAMGPTGPPIPGSESNSLSSKVMTG